MTAEATLVEAPRGSFLAELPEMSIRQVLQGAEVIDLAPADVVVRQGHSGRLVFVCIDGVLRQFKTSVGGREVTIRYLRQGDSAGVPSLFVERFAWAGSVAALTEARILRLQTATLEAAGRDDPAICWALASEVALLLGYWLEEIGRQAFLGVRQRIGRQLLEAAEWSHADRALAATFTHLSLAEAVGSVPEVVGRELRGLAAIGALRLGRGRVIIVKPELIAADLASGGNPTLDAAERMPLRRPLPRPHVNRSVLPVVRGAWRTGQAEPRE